ncbi:MAG: TetR/AcrR family transcriptional regulator [Flavobacteriales bacterium]
METKERIISESIQLFIHRGVRSVNMDEISSQLGISKKTLYQYFSNKQELVFVAFEHLLLKMRKLLNEKTSIEKNAIDELFEMDDEMYKLVKQISIPLVIELKKYYRDTWNLVDQFKKTFLFDIISQNINKGIEQGLFLDSIKVDFIAKIYISRSENLVDVAYFSNGKFDFKEVLLQYRIYHLRGISTLKGLEYLEKKLTK